MKTPIRKSLTVPAKAYDSTGVADFMRQRSNARYRAYKLGDVDALQAYQEADERYWAARRRFMELCGIPLYEFVEVFPKRDPDNLHTNLSYEFVWWESQELTGSRKVAYDMVKAVTELQLPYRNDVVSQAHELAKRNGIYIAKRRFIDLTDYGYKCHTVTEWSPENFPKVYEFDTREAAEEFALSIEARM